MWCRGMWNTSRVDLVQRERRRSVCATCRLQNVSALREEELAVQLQNQPMYMVDDRYKAIYCYIPKSGCTMWKIKLVSLHTANGVAPFHDVGIHDVLNHKNQYGLQRLDLYNYKERVHRLRTYYKYTIVRHPLVRLVSVYRQAFTISKTYIALIPDILTKVRPNWTKAQINKNNKMDNYNFTFTEFLNYLFTYADSKFRTDFHWAIMTDLCSPCLVRYNYISNLETIKDDSHHLLTTVYNSTTNNLAVTPHNRNTSHSIAIMHFKQVPEALRRKVLQHYRGDADMFGYSFDGFS